MKKLILLMSIMMMVPCLSQADRTDPSKEDYREASQTLQDATKVYEDIVMKSPQGQVPKSVLNSAKCIAVFPKVITAAIVVGGTHGDGIVTCRSNDKWSTPSIASLTGGSLGAQIGGKSTDLVLFITNDDAVKTLKKGKFAIGADASVAVGSYDAAADLTKSGVVAYQRNEGGYLGASLGAGNIKIDEDANMRLYGKDAHAVNMLEGRASTQTAAGDTFLTLLPNA